MLRISQVRDGTVLFILTLLFLGRVMAQLVECFIDINFIPDFEEWHSATLPYWLLFSFQVVILYFMFLATLKAYRGSIRPSKKLGGAFRNLGYVYFFSMIIRHVLGLSLLSHTVWFTSFLSIYFHYVLSLFLIFYGYIHIKASRIQ